ncbi:MAG: hypothetical protein ABSB68_14115 [Acidimicrobiales bacterium]|jgi:hypothetical protein
MADVTADPSRPATPAVPAVDVAPTGGPVRPPSPPPGVAAPVASRSERRRQRKSGVRWKAVATVVLLCALGAAVTVVLLQSAGLISWGFLGPTA